MDALGIVTALVTLSARWAYPEENDPVAQNGKVAFVSNGIHQVIYRFNRCIVKATAGYAPNVVVVCRVAIKTHLTGQGPNLLYQSPGREGLQIAVNCTQAYMGQSFTNHFIELICCGMSCDLSDFFKNNPSLRGHPSISGRARRKFCIHFLIMLSMKMLITCLQPRFYI